MERWGNQRQPTNGQNSYQVDAFTEEPTQENDVLFHMVPETKNTRWNHVEDLDSFFYRVYNYHQKNGFWCIFVQAVFDIIIFVFLVTFATFLSNCIDYNILFRNNNTTDIHSKITLPDAILPVGECVTNFSFGMWFMLLIAFVFLAIRVVCTVRNTVLNLEIRAFYRSALNIPDNELENLTWYDVQKRLRDVQREQLMCIQKPELTELDIYHRILRFKNYFLAMLNKKLLPVDFSLPFVGDIVYLTHGLKFNYDVILFWGPGSPFENSWHLKEDYKKASKRKELAVALSRRILWVGLGNLVLAPVILVWQIMHAFYTVAENLKREPGSLGTRMWSRFARNYLRHFNELEHERHARLVRAYRPASKYMSIFTSPMMTVIAKNLAIIFATIAGSLTLLTIWDEDVIAVEHVLFIVTVCGVACTVLRTFIPDENMVFCPEKLLTGVLAHVHYFPDHWKGQAHTLKTREQFSLLFQYRLVSILEELVSPLVTPFILIFWLRPRALDIVDFYRNFTVDVVGVGDVCSFAQMDVRKHGNPAWQTNVEMDGSESMEHAVLNNNANNQADNGKTELSLVHFTHTNPEWSPPESSGFFISNLKERVVRDANNLPTVLEENALFSSLNTISSLGGDCSNIINNFMIDRSLLHLSVPPAVVPNVSTDQQRQQQHQNSVSFKGSVSRQEGPLYGGQRGIVSGVHQSGLLQAGSVYPQSNNISFANSFAHYPLQFQNHSATPSLILRSPPSELDGINLEASNLNMCMDALYIHELHHQELRRRHNRNSTIGGFHNPSHSAYQMEGTSQYQHQHQPPLHQNQQHQLHFQVPAQQPLSNPPPPPLVQLQRSQQPQPTNEKTPLLHGGGGTYS